MTKLTLYFIGAAVLLIALGVLTWNFDPFGRRKHAEQKAAVATEQAAFQAEAVKQLDHYTNTVTVIREKQDAAVEAVQSAPGADAPLDPARRALLCAQLASVRGSPVCTDDSPRAEVP